MFIMGQYKAAYAPDHPRRLENNRIYEHVLVAEEKLGRYLKDGEVVHYIVVWPSGKARDFVE